MATNDLPYNPSDDSNLRNRTMVTTKPAPVAASSPGVRGFGLEELKNRPQPATADQLAALDQQYRLLLQESIRADGLKHQTSDAFTEYQTTYNKAAKEDRKAMQPEYDAAKKSLDDASKVAEDASAAVVKARQALDDAKGGKPIPADQPDTTGK